MKSSDLKAMPVEDLEGKLEESVKGLYQLRVRASTKELDNTAQIRTERRNVARLRHAIANARKGEGAGEKPAASAAPKARKS